MFFALCLGNFFFKLSIMGGRGKRKQLAGLPASHPPIHPSSFIQTKNSSMCFMDLCFLDVGPGSRAFTCARESFSGENSCSSPSALRWWFSFPASHSKANFFFFWPLFLWMSYQAGGEKRLLAHLKKCMQYWLLPWKSSLYLAAVLPSHSNQSVCVMFQS